jgi:hypothetical protein
MCESQQVAKKQKARCMPAGTTSTTGDVSPEQTTADDDDDDGRWRSPFPLNCTEDGSKVHQTDKFVQKKHSEPIGPSNHFGRTK